jgi:plastocyanin
MRNPSVLTAIGLLSMCVSGIALAATEFQVGQKGRSFSQENMVIAVGDHVVFINDDTVSHNIMSTSSGNDFNLGSLAPGVSVPVTFDKAGLVNVICAIHPRMKLNIQVN